MKKVSDILKEKNKTFSLELFPPKTPKGYENLLSTIALFAELKPDFISCTYGAGGGNRDKTLDIAQHVQEQHRIPAIAHLTCVLNTRDQIKEILKDIQGRGLCNILALRGDPPADNPHWTAGPKNFRYSCDLCQFAREHFANSFSIGVAGFPEGHPDAPDLTQDALYLKNKLQKGGDFVVTQLFLDNHYYFDYLDRLRTVGVQAKVIPGILPIANYNRLLEFSLKDGIRIPEKVKKIFEPIKDNPEQTLEAGKAFAIEQCRDLLKNGAPGIHFYALNKIHPLKDIFLNIKDLL